MTKILFILLFVFPSFFPGTGVYRSSLEGKLLSDTPFGHYIPGSLPGQTLLVLVAYGCSHCEEATKETMKLKAYTDRLLILGSGTEEEKRMFLKNTGADCKMYDYDFSQMRTEILAADKDFPPPPVCIYIRNNVLRKVFLKIPEPARFAKISGNTKK